ncbi:MAG: ATP-binding cassette domain-containing protein, partial [Pygmaiobacter sp.]
GKLKYENFSALQHISFSVNKGEVFGIIGRNGAGKSTLLKAISGIIKPTQGSVTAYGNIVPMLELGSGFDYDLSGRENVFLNGAILGYSKALLNERF